ncbi:MAG: cytochrome c biogenesis protein CcsA [Planctomycetes bacterium]|nr:cytochrome c biogenesis protein CcsA [Planctomycetota bacterium]
MVYDYILVHITVAGYALATGLGFESVRRRRSGLMTAARSVAGTAILVSMAVLLRRGVELGAFPIVSRFETNLFIAALLTGLALMIDLLRGMPIMTLAAAPLSCLTVLAGTILGAPAGEASVAMRSAWTGLHVLTMLGAYGAFGLSFVTAVLYLIERRQLKAHASPGVLGIMPSLETFNRLTVHCLTVGVALMTVGILIGYMYARKTPDLPSGWRVDPKVWGATLTWALYVAVLLLSFTPAFKGKRTALASVGSFILVMTSFWAAAFWSDFHRFL